MRISFLKIISISIALFALIVFFLALNIDKRYNTEKIVGKSVDNFEIKFLNKIKNLLMKFLKVFILHAKEIVIKTGIYENIALIRSSY